MAGFEFNLVLNSYLSGLFGKCEYHYIFLYHILHLKVLKLQNKDFCYPKDFARNKMLCMH